MYEKWDKDLPTLFFFANCMFLDQIPELTGGLPLILNLHIVADILLNKITTWNDPRIISLNPAFERTLPNKSIIVVYPNQPTSLTGVLGRALSFIYEFNEKVSALLTS